MVAVPKQLAALGSLHLAGLGKETSELVRRLRDSDRTIRWAALQALRSSLLQLVARLRIHQPLLGD